MAGEVQDILTNPSFKPSENVGAVAQAPRSSLSPSELAQPGQDMARALEKWSQATNAVAVPLAERQAYADLAHQKVTRDANGNIQILNPANSILFGESGQRYGEIVRQGTAAQASDVLGQQMTDLHLRNPTDANAFKAGSDALLDKYADQFGDTAWGAATIAHGRSLQTEHYDSIANYGARLSIDNNKKALLAGIDQEENDLAAMARQEGTDSPNYKRLFNKYVGDTGALAANPQYGMPQGLIDQQRTQFDLRIKGEVLLGSIPKMIDEQGMTAARGQVKDMLASGAFDPKTRSYLQWESRNILAEATPKWRDENRAFEAGVKGVYAKMRAPGGLNLNDPDLQQMVKKGRARGYDAEPELEGMIANAPFLKTMSRLTPEQREQRLLAAPEGSPAAPGGLPGNQPAAQPPQSSMGGDSYKARVAQIENPAGTPGATSPAGARGFYQWMPGTAATYGVTPGDRASEESGMDRFTADNRAALTQGLGRNPSDAELYLAHQQGAQGALHLMAEPGRRAADIVGEKAITGNGGNANMTAGDFVAMWKAKFDKTSAGEGTTRWSDAQISANPWLNAFIFQKEAQDPTEKLNWYSAVARTFEKNMDYGGTPSPEQWADIERVHDDMKGNPPFEEVYAGVKGKLEALLAQKGTPEQRDAFMAQASAIGASSGGDPYIKEQANVFTKAFSVFDKQWKQDPIDMAATAGLINRRVSPLDFSNNGSARQGFAERSFAAEAIHTARGQWVPAIQGDDLDQVKRVLSAGSTSEKMALLDGMSVMIPQVQQATLQKLGSDPQTAPLAVASSLMSQNQPQAAQAILQGMQLLATNPRFAPKEDTPDGMEVHMNEKLPFNDYPTAQGRDALTRAVRAVYAVNAARNGDESQVYNKNFLEPALATVTGGILDYRDHKVIAPAYNGTVDDLDARMRGLTDADLAGAVIRDKPLTADQVNGAAFSPGFTHLNRPLVSLESVPNSPGHYFLFNGDDASRQYVRAKDGTYFSLDLSAAARPQPMQLPGAAAPSPVGTIEPGAAMNNPELAPPLPASELRQ